MMSNMSTAKIILCVSGFWVELVLVVEALSYSYNLCI